MRILLTGATGYIGKRLLPLLVEEGHTVFCCVRDIERFNPPKSLKNFVEVVQVDFLDANSLRNIPDKIDVAYYLIHSMSSSENYDELEARSADNFKTRLAEVGVKQVIYLSGMINEENLSKHLNSRKRVEEILSKGNFALTTFRAGIIIGSGSASFEIIRDLVEKLPVMIAPKWLNTKCQPIGVKDVLHFLVNAKLIPEVYNKDFDIGSPDILTYKQMLLQFAAFRQLKRKILTVPVLTPKLSSYWLYFVTSTSYRLAKALVDSMKVEVIGRPSNINDILDVQPETYQKALERAFDKIATNQIISSWKDSQVNGVKRIKISDFIEVPEYGCLKDIRKRKFKSRSNTIDKVWRIGGDNGWYFANFLWKIRGYLDKLFGGIGLRRGRTNADQLSVGDALDFWRVIYVNKQEGKLVLFAEMKLPGEAWLEFNVKDDTIVQKAVFRPQGLWGRLYWYLVIPFHEIVFRGLINKLAS